MNLNRLTSRRSFLRAGAAAGGGLLLSFSLPLDNRKAAAADAVDFAPNAFVRIGTDGQIVLTMPYVEMGQGTYTSIPMLLAEELEVDLNQVRLEHAPPNEKLYGNPLLGGLQATGNSNAVRAAWQPLRQAGATARTLLVLAAAKRWNVDPASCRAESGEVLHPATGRSMKYGALAAKAVGLPVPDEVALKRPHDFKLIGTPAKRLDTPAKVDEGAIDLVYALANMHVEYVQAEPPGIPTAFWRSVGPSHTVFVVESFMDELAAAAKQDPVAYRLALLDKAPRAKAVLALAAEKAGWGQKLPERVGRGVSLQFVFATFMAQVAEVEVAKDGAVRVRRVVCAVDCGTVVNPDTVQAQIQGAVIFGITAALYGKITLKDGRVEQTNFDSYEMLRMNETPVIEVHIVPSSEPPGGMGECGTSAVVPAVANAIFAATGKRLRKMPVDTAALKQ